MAEKSISKGRFGEWGAIVAAVVLASLVWFHAVTEHSYRRELTVPLVVEDPPASASGGEMLVANQVPSEALIVVSGSGKDLLFDVRGEDFLIRVQAPSGRPGARLPFRVTTELVERPDVDVRVEEILRPREIEVLLEQRADKEVPIHPFVRFQVADSYTPVGGVRLEPKSVRISGPRSQVESVRVMRTDSLVMPPVYEDVEKNLSLRPPSGSRLELSHSYVTVRIDIQELAEYDIPSVPVQIRNARGIDLVAEPSRVQVRVKGGADVIGGLDSERDLKLYVDHAAWLRDTQQGGIVHWEPDSLFEIRQVVPAAVNIVSR